jgi:hypothetical protein
MRLFFIHIPKCAGMTLHHIIEQQYAPDEIYTVPSVGWNERNLQSLTNEWSAADKDRIRVVKGHMNYGWHSAFRGEYEYFTILRHPVERVLSFFAHVSEGHPAYEERQMGLSYFVHHCEEASNHATFMLSGGEGRNDRAFYLAWDRLQSMLAGTVEHFNGFVEKLRIRYGWSNGFYPIKNQTRDRLRDISAQDEQAILQLNQYDLMLYAHAVRETCNGL